MTTSSTVTAPGMRVPVREGGLTTGDTAVPYDTSAGLREEAAGSSGTGGCIRLRLGPGA